MSSKNALITLESKNSRKTQLTNLSVTGTVGASFALPAIGEAISSAGAAIAGLVSWPVVAVGVAVVVVAGGISYLVYKSNSKDEDKGASGAEEREYKKPKKGSGKEKASDTPSWSKGKKPYKGESGKDYSKRLMDEKYGEGNWKTSDREYSQLKKYGDRGYE